MKTIIYTSGNPWQRKAYSHLSEYLAKKGVNEFGVSDNGNSYKHLLRKEDGEKNFITHEIYDLTLERFVRHKAGDLNRILTNTASSQAYCFNIFLHLNKNKELSNRLFSELMGKSVRVEHIELEFTPNMMQLQPFSESTTPSNIITTDKDESIGDQSKYGGTDADVAVFYRYKDDKKGVLLIEFKFIEAEFSVCSSYKNKQEVRGYCSTPNYYLELVENQLTDSRQKPLCGYTRYLNWTLTKESNLFNENVTLSDTSIDKKFTACPFRFGLNQLWRNLLLSERVAQVRECDEFGFWVLSPKENEDYLWKQKSLDVEQLFREVLSEKGNQHFRKVDMEELYCILDRLISTDENKEWLIRLKEKYRIE